MAKKELLKKEDNTSAFSHYSKDKEHILPGLRVLATAGDPDHKETLPIKIRHITQADTLNTSLPTFFLKALSVLLIMASHGSQVCGPDSTTSLT